MRWLPNQKILRGAPPTRISLESIIERFVSEGAFANPAEVTIEVDPSSSLVPGAVDPIIQDHDLILQWDSDAVGKADIILRFSSPNSPPTFLQFTAEPWAPNWWALMALVVGGIGLFIFGIRNMSDGIQLIAGSSLRRMIAVFTEHRVFAFAVGIITTMLLQSSTVVTVMVIGFVNSQIMTLAQGIGVILGANIGTTATGWILTLDIGKFGLPIAGVSIFFFLFCKREKIRFLAQAAMGLGLVFYGLQVMTNGLAELQELPEFSIWIKMFSADTFLGSVKCALVGCILTIIMQSSAATIGVTMSLVVIGAIEFPTAAALVLGENIGTTLTAQVVAIGSSTNAKRAAAFHAIFNITGVVWVLLVFSSFFLPLVTKIAGVNGSENVVRGVAATHTLFNVTNALIFLPFSKKIARFLTWAIPERVGPRERSCTGLVLRSMETPAFAISRVNSEIQRMASGCRELGQWVQTLVNEGLENDKLANEAFAREKWLDQMQDEVIDFTSEMLSRNLSTDDAELAREQIRIADEIESVSDYFIALLKSDLKLKEENLTIPELIVSEFDQFHHETLDLFDRAMSYYNDSMKNIRYNTQEFYLSSREMVERIKNLRDRFYQLISEEKIDTHVVVAVNAQFNSYRRIWEHLRNIVQALEPRHRKDF